MGKICLIKLLNQIQLTIKIKSSNLHSDDKCQHIR